MLNFQQYPFLLTIHKKKSLSMQSILLTFVKHSTYNVNTIYVLFTNVAGEFFLENFKTNQFIYKTIVR